MDVFWNYTMFKGLQCIIVTISSPEFRLSLLKATAYPDSCSTKQLERNADPGQGSNPKSTALTMRHCASTR